MTDFNAQATTLYGLDQMPRAVCWAILTPEQARRELDKLADWVTWVRDRYHLDRRTIPACWAEHGDLVEELSALRTSWQPAYSADGRPDAPLIWHSNFAATRLRLTEAVARAGCRPGEHRAA